MNYDKRREEGRAGRKKKKKDGKAEVSGPKSSGKKGYYFFPVFFFFGQLGVIEQAEPRKGARKTDTQRPGVRARFEWKLLPRIL